MELSENRKENPPRKIIDGILPQTGFRNKHLQLLQQVSNPVYETFRTLGNRGIGILKGNCRLNSQRSRVRHDVGIGKIPIVGILDTANL